MIEQPNSRTVNKLNCETPDIRIMLMLANSLDCEALMEIYSQQQQIGAMEASCDLDVGLAKCRRLIPHVLVIDPNIDATIITKACEAIYHNYTSHAIILDNRLHEGRLAAILKMPSLSYILRQSGFAALLAATIRVATCRERVFDPSLSNRLRRTKRGWRIEQAHGRPSVASLTARELDVMKLLASGGSVRDCAKKLQLAESTIDNHKSRLMKKLAVHKAAELTTVAIRDGLITV